MINVVDLETASMEAGVVEIAVVRVPPPERGWLHMTSLVKPGCPIDFGAMATHHITEDMVRDVESLNEVVARHDFDANEVWAAHNAKFDRSFMPKSIQDRRWICTWRVALHLWPDMASHSNQYLRYALNLDVTDMPEEAGTSPHRALYDAWCTARLLQRQMDVVRERLVEGVDANSVVEELVQLSSAPVILRKVRFGKYRDKLWADVDRGYLQWCLKQGDMDPDVLHTCRHHLGMLT